MKNILQTMAYSIAIFMMNLACVFAQGVDLNELKISSDPQDGKRLVEFGKNRAASNAEFLKQYIINYELGDSRCFMVMTPNLNRDGYATPGSKMTSYSYSMQQISIEIGAAVKGVIRMTAQEKFHTGSDGELRNTGLSLFLAEQEIRYDNGIITGLKPIDRIEHKDGKNFTEIYAVPKKLFEKAIEKNLKNTVNRIKEISKEQSAEIDDVANKAGVMLMNPDKFTEIQAAGFSEIQRNKVANQGK